MGERVGDFSEKTRLLVTENRARSVWIDMPSFVSAPNPQVKTTVALRSPSPLVPRLGRLLTGGAALLGLLISAWAAPEEAAKKFFDLPADAAAKSLKLFSEQAGTQVIFPSQVARGIQTRGVKGEMTPRHALEGMLTGTGLVAVQDESTGAFAIRRETAEEKNVEGAARGDRPENETAKNNPTRTYSGEASNPPASGSGTILGRVQNAVTGTYLNKARVSIQGTNLFAFTDEFGYYRLLNVPSGPHTLEVFYTDLDRRAIPVNLESGARLEVDVDLTSVARYGADPAVVRLNTFVVSSDKETDGKAIAVNEQRFAPNIKNVLATDAFGDVLGSNLGEFLKFVPGLTADYTQQDITGISIRGIGSDKTVFTADGSPIATANSNSSRVFNIAAIDLNNIARIDVTKVPTPSSAADTLSGSIDMISKSAFERSKAQFNYHVTLVGNSENLTLRKTPHTNGDKNTYKVLPTVDFDYTLPIGKKFGIVITGIYSSKFNEQHLFTSEYSTSGTGTTASFARPFLSGYTLQDGPRTYNRRTLTFKADWKSTPNSVLSFGVQNNWNTSAIGTQSWAFGTSTNGTPATATGVALTYDENQTLGATGRGSVNLTGGGQSTNGGIDVANLNWRYDDGQWNLKAGLNASHSTRGRPDNGHFASLTATLVPAVRVALAKGGSDWSKDITVTDNNQQPVNVYDLSNYRLTGATESHLDNITTFKSANLDVRRRLASSSVPAAFQAGGAVREMALDTRLQSINWTYNGPDGNPATADSPAPYLMQVYKNQDSYYGFKNVPWPSVNRAWRAFQDNPVLFSQTPAQIVAQENYRRTNSESVVETVSAGYVQAEARLLQNRLNVLTGVRFERTTDEGEGPLSDPNAVYVRNADGTFAHNAAGARIRRPDAGAAGSLDELQLILRERAYKASRTYQGYYPSLHLTYEAREGLLVRLAYARTYGRPNFTDIIPNATINERDLDEGQLADPTVVRGTITVRNTGLRPWTADNYDLSLEYYTQNGGLLSAGLFVKNISDFFGTEVRLATAADLEQIGLDSRYVGWNLSTKFNAGDAKISGGELNLRQSLRALGAWGSYFTVFANATRLQLEGNRTADFSSFIPKTANWGITFSRQKVTLSAKWNYRGLNRLTASPVFGPDAFQYYGARTTLGLNASYQMTPRLSLAASANNVLNVPEILRRYGSETPAYARQIRTSQFGVAMAIGLQGRF